MCPTIPYSRFEIDQNISLLVIDIEGMNSDLKQILDQNFVSICEGNSGSSIEIVKKEVSNLFSNKSEIWIEGAIAEFFTHLILKNNKFKQECLFLNLEENSIKKGFDGFYSRNGETWIMESKAGSINAEGISHSKKITLALRDLSDRVSGKKSENGSIINPWHNAYSHACHCDVGSSESIREYIKKLSNDCINRRYHSIDIFNNIPSSTIFLNNKWTSPDHSKIRDEIFSIKKKLKGAKVIVICMTQSSVDTFKNYIKGI